MFNILFAFVLLFQTVDLFAPLEKMIAKHTPALSNRDAAFKQFRTVVETGNTDPIRAYTSYMLAATVTDKAWLDLEAELSRVTKLVNGSKDKPSDQKTRGRLTKITAQAEAFMKHPAGYDEVMRKYQARIKEPSFGPRPPQLPKPKRP